MVNRRGRGGALWKNMLSMWASPCRVPSESSSHKDSSPFLAQFSGMPLNWLWKKPLGGITARTRFDRKEDGNSSWFCPGCCCTGIQVVD